MFSSSKYTNYVYFSFQLVLFINVFFASQHISETGQYWSILSFCFILFFYFYGHETACSRY